jgi:hypothetical protein
VPLVSIAAQNASLDGDYGTTRGPHAADSHELALYDDDPVLGGVELADSDCPGYARVPVAPEDWAAAVGGAKGTTLPVQFQDATGDWARQARFWALIDAADHVTIWDSAELNISVNVLTGSGPAVQPTVFYSNFDDL